MPERSETIMPVSIVIPAYNAELTLSQTLESVLAQTFGEWEAIVVNV
jgi:glycosyltransferase involved in cell wall biosynthesis